VRSSDIRSAIGSGALGRAEELLGRPYSIVATCRDGGSLGFGMPVALPPAGKYRVDVAEDAIARRPATLIVEGGVLRLQPSTGLEAGARCIVAFAGA
jgi:hypothetical protein